MALHGSIWNALGSTMFSANTFALLLLISRFFDVGQVGVFSIAFTTAQMMYLVGLFGANYLQMTDYARQYDFKSYAKVKAISTGVALVCCAVSVWALGFSYEKALLTWVLTLYMLLHSTAELYQSLMFQNDRLDLAGQSLFFRTLISLICFAAMLFFTRDVLLSSVVMLVVGIVALWIWSVRPSRPYIKAEKKLSTANVPALLRECVPMFGGSLLMNIILNIPRYAIDSFYTDDTQGIFGMIFILVQVITLMSSFIFKPILKKISEAVGNALALRRIMLQQAAIVLIITLVCAAGAWIAGPELLGIIYGVDLTAQRLPLASMILGGGILAYCQLLYYIMVVMRRQRQIFASCIVTTLAAVLCSVVMVQRWGIMGAIGAFVATHLVLLVLYLWAVFSGAGHRPGIESI